MRSEKMPPPAKQGEYRRAQRHIEAVAQRLDECLTDHTLSGQGWDGLSASWRSAERAMSNVEDYVVWSDVCEDCEKQSSQAIREYLLTAAASLLDLSSHIEAMRRAAR